MAGCPQVHGFSCEDASNANEDTPAKHSVLYHMAAKGKLDGSDMSHLAIRI